jgi:hypothetical protein
MLLSTASLSALHLITQFTSGAMFLTKQTGRSFDMGYSKCMGAGCFCPNSKNNGRTGRRLSGDLSVSRQRREKVDIPILQERKDVAFLISV